MMTPNVMAESATLNVQKSPGAEVEVDEIDHRTAEDAVEQVARGTAAHQREADAREQLMARQSGGVHADADQCARGDERDDNRLARKIDAVQETERRAGIPHM